MAMAASSRYAEALEPTLKNAVDLTPVFDAGLAPASLAGVVVEAGSEGVAVAESEGLPSFASRELSPPAGRWTRKTGEGNTER